MGWGNGEVDGKKVGYNVEDVCNHEGCTTEIDRGLAYACGGYHGAGEDSCDKYFCYAHLIMGKDCIARCPECHEMFGKRNAGGE